MEKVRVRKNTFSAMLRKASNVMVVRTMRFDPMCDAMTNCFEEVDLEYLTKFLIQFDRIWIYQVDETIYEVCGYAESFKVVINK
jgi:hypothetical protein